MDRPYIEGKTEKWMYVVDGIDAQFSVKNNKVDYGEGFLDANSEEFYNSESVTFLEWMEKVKKNNFIKFMRVIKK